MAVPKEEASSIRRFIKKNLKIHAPASTRHARPAQLRGRRAPPELHARGRRTGADPGGGQPPDQGDGGTAGPRPLHAQQPQHAAHARSEEHTSELQSPCNLVCRLLLEKKKNCMSNSMTAQQP